MKQISSVLLSISLFSLSACQQRLYFPDTANSPCFKGAKELKVSFGTKLQANDNDQSNRVRGSASSPSFDVAYSLTDNIAFIGSYRSTLNRFIAEQQFLYSENYGGMFNGHRFEGGGGYYTTFDKTGRIEIFAGYGNGTLRRASTYTPQYDFNTRYHRFFIQPAFGFGTDYFNIMFGARVAVHKYYDFQSANPDLATIITNNVGTHYPSATSDLFTFFEPYCNIEVGYKYVRFYEKMGFTLQQTGGHISGNMPIYFAVGFTFYYTQGFFPTLKKPTTAL